MRKLRFSEVIRHVHCPTAEKWWHWCQGWPCPCPLACPFRSWLMPVMLWPPPNVFTLTSGNPPSTCTSQNTFIYRFHIVCEDLLGPEGSARPQICWVQFHMAHFITDWWEIPGQNTFFKFRNTNKHTEYFPRVPLWKHRCEGIEPNAKWKIHAGEGRSE